MFKHLSIGLKIAFIAIVGFVGILIFQSANYRLSVNLQDQLHKVFYEDFVILKFSNDIQINFSDLDKLYQAALIEADMDTLMEADIKARSMRQEFKQFQKKHTLNIAVYNNLINAFNTYTDTTSAHTSAVLSGQLGYQQTLMGYDQIGLLKQDYEQTQSQFFEYCYAAFEKQLTVIQGEGKFLVDFGLLLGILLTLILGIVSFFVIKNLISAFHKVVNLAQQIAEGNLDQEIKPRSNDETGKMMLSLKAMQEALKKQREDDIQRERTQDFLSELNETMRGDPNLDQLLTQVLQYFVHQFSAENGNIYLFDHEQKLLLQSSVGLSDTPINPAQKSFEHAYLGEVARAAYGRILNPQKDDITPTKCTPLDRADSPLMLLPISKDSTSIGVIELESSQPFTDDDLALISKGNAAVFIAINSANARTALANMLTQTQEQAKVLKDQRHELEVSGRYKSQFLSTMSHELRTPLNSILILSESLVNNRSGLLSQQEVQNAHVIHNAGNELLSLINDILDLSKIEEGKMDVVWEKLDIRLLADNLFHTFDLQAKNKQLTYQVKVAINVPILIGSDSFRLKQILKNFISNALKFTDTGGVYVDFRVAAENGRSTKDLKISVRDTGLGIKNAMQDDVFEAFKQLDGTTSRKYGGTGLGLSISRELAKLLDGQVGLYSAGDNQGSCFTLTIPINPKIADQELLARQAPLPIETSYPSGFNKHLSTAKVLIVEDNPVLIQTMRSVFTKNDVPVIIETSGEKAFAAIKTHLFSCLIIDLNLPDYQDESLFKAIRELDDYKDTPLIVFTAEDLSLTEKKRIQQLADYIILKTPKAIKEVCLLTKTILATQFREHKIKEKNIEYDFNGKQLLLVDDDERNLYSLSLILKDAGLDVTLARSGQEALEAIKHDKNIDVMLLDIMMPIMDGYQVMEKLKRQQSQLPIIALTAKAMATDKEKCLAAGASQYLSKPVDRKDLLYAIAVEIA